MKLNNTIFSILVASGLALSLSSCKKDKDSDASSDLANVTITVETDDDNDPLTPNVPVKDAVIVIGFGFDLLQDVEDKDKQTDAEGKFTYKGILKGDYSIGADDGNVSGQKGVQLLPGDNEVTVIVN